MSLDLTVDQALALAPDPAAAAAGRKLGNKTPWQGLGRNERALWGECKGSALYQVRVDLQDLTASCSCPSRKFPCKHGLGLLLLTAGTPAALPESVPPEWVTTWLARRADVAEKRQARAAEAATAPQAERDTAQQSKRAEKRLTLVSSGLDALDLWLCDLVRNGLAGLELQPPSFWERQAARLVDAQAPGVAQRVRRLGAIPGSSPDWPDRLLAGLGRLALLIQAFRRFETLDPALQADVRSLIGWTLKEDEVVVQGEMVRDTWMVLGQWIDESDDRVRAQRTWLLGTRTRRTALVLQFSAMGASFGQSLIPGTTIEADLAYWPGAYAQRALIHQRYGPPQRLAGEIPGAGTLDEFLSGVAGALARNPWLESFPCALKGVRPLPAAAHLYRRREAASGNARDSV